MLQMKLYMKRQRLTTLLQNWKKNKEVRLIHELFRLAVTSNNVFQIV